MARFAAGEVDVLVATSVIEVGIDVPNATVMVIEEADRYGISQLHQLRGRVGRGRARVVLPVVLRIARRSLPRHRLEAVAAERDGFRLAEVDLTLRGEGDVLGTRQSGLPEFRVARLPEDAELLELARAESIELLARGPRARRPRARACCAWRSSAASARSRSSRSPPEAARCGSSPAQFKGRRLAAPRRARTRPTPDRVREALFSMLGPLDGLRVLDLYAGSGALGIEALSRGARRRRSSTPTPPPCARCARTSSGSGRTAGVCSGPTRCLPARRRPAWRPLGLGPSATRLIDSRPALGLPRAASGPRARPRGAHGLRELSRNIPCAWTCRSKGERRYGDTLIAFHGAPESSS